MSDNPEVVILPAREEHLPDIFRIAREAFLVADGWSEASLSEELHRPFSFVRVALVDGVVRAYLVFWVVQGEAQILQIATDPAMVRLGIGKKLMEWGLEEGASLGAQTFFLEVRVSNEPALALYRRVGFRRIAVRKRYYEHPAEDAVVMARE